MKNHHSQIFSSGSSGKTSSSASSPMIIAKGAYKSQSVARSIARAQVWPPQRKFGNRYENLLCTVMYIVTDLDHKLGRFIPKIQPVSCCIRISSSAAFLLATKESSKPRFSFLNEGESPRESPEQEPIKEPNQSLSLSRAVSHEDQLLVVPRPNLITAKRFLGLAGGLTT